MLDEPLLLDLFDEAFRKSGAYGAQLTVVKDDQQLDFAAGYADADRGIAMTTDTVMQIGSITKVFNATVVATLVEEGLLDYDTPVREYLPGFEVSDREATETLTLRRLLSMCSGLDNGPYVYFGPGEDALGRYVANLDTIPQHFRPGEFFAYSNAGTCIAGHTAATVAGKPWETLVRERILEPAALKSGTLLDEDRVGKAFSSGHYPQPGSDRPTVVAPIFSDQRSRGPSGSVFALAAGDLARFGRMFANRGVADTGSRILSEELVARMTEPQIPVPTRMFAHAWGIGPWVDDWQGTTLWGHAGGTPTSSSILQWIPAQNAAIAFIVNTFGTAFVDFRKLVFAGLTEAAFGLRRTPTAQPEGAVEPLDERRYVGTYDSLDMRLHVTRGEGETLLMRSVPQRSAEALKTNTLIMDQPEQTISLRPLGGDRFLLAAVDGPDVYRDELDTAFFGDDGSGRATNLLNGVFATSRIPG
jgi:CubicO group peptidase (beta-lactamase class C family)